MVGNSIEQKHIAFEKGTYEAKLNIYDGLFDILPFHFPQLCFATSWFDNSIFYAKLVEYLNRDKRENKLLSQSIVETGKTYVFNIKPLSQVQRIQFNNFIIKKFLSVKASMLKQINEEVKKAGNEQHYFQTKIDQYNTIINKIRETINYSKDLLQSQLLNVFYNGYVAAESNIEKMIKSRKTFVELYLYSQGLLLAEVITYLQSGREHLQKTAAFLNLEQKLALLKQLGIIDFLHSQMHKDEYICKITIPEIIRLLCSELPNKKETIKQFLNQ